MANAARFTNAELAELDRRISEAAGRAAAREARIFATLVAEVLAQAAACAGPPRRSRRWTCCNPAPAWRRPEPGAAPA